MKRAAAIVVVLLSISMAGLRAQQTFRSGIDLVYFGVVVTDRQGAPITGLTAADFDVIENGKPQTISYFSAGDPEEAPPLHLGFLLDTSGSMEDDLRDVRTAAIKFLNAIETAVDVTLVDFATEVRVSRFSASEYPRLIERIRGRRADGYTALYDALGTYLNGAASQNGQKILVMYTDGGDTHSSITQNEVLNLLKASDVTVYVIGYLEHQLSSVKMDQRIHLQRFADATGGQALFPVSVKEVEKMYDKVQREIAARYSIGYSSTDTRMDGNWRKVEIRLKRPDLKGARIRTRGGYFGPFKASERH